MTLGSRILAHSGDQKVAAVPPPPIFPYNLFRSSMTIFLPGRETKRGKIKVVLFALNGEGGNGPHAGNTRAPRNGE